MTLEQSSDFKVILVNQSGNNKNYVSQDIVKNIKVRHN